MIQISKAGAAIVGAAMVLSAAALPISPAGAQGRAALVGVDPVVKEPLQQTTPILGRLVSRQRGVVAALTRGPVEDIRVDVGDRVAAGDVLVQIGGDRIAQDLRSAGAELSVARARVDTARAELASAKIELERLARLRQSAAFSQARYDDQTKEVATRESEVREAEASVAVAASEVRMADIDVRFSTVRAPFDGVVVARHTERGAFLNIGEPVVTLINDNDLEIEADVPATRLSGLAQGREIEARLSDAVSIAAFVRAVIPEENALTRTRVVRFTPAVQNLASDLASPLAANQSVTVMIPVGDARTVVSVHKDAVIPRGDGHMVFVVNEGTVAPRPIQLGEAVATRFEVLNGLAPGEIVVIRGNERLRPGQSVTYPGMPEPSNDESSAPNAASGDDNKKAT
ncbi:MAG: efflux RND transporter periplasmic adaptor subunit [Alphaproteobacteria bacterium]|nr:efflux RND transporter periplasmic adaptor subunit [Alphaproteobacteria bacterium]